MYGSVLVVLSTLELFGNSADPQIGKAAPGLPKAQAEVADLSGYYTCKGQEAGGKAYSGICVLTKKNEVYLIQWVVGNGSNFNGIAIRQGNTLAASWSIVSERGIVRGVNMYKVESTNNGAKLSGRWASVPGPGVQQTETLSFLKKLDTEEEEQ
jgi:hypothetical protein